MDWLYLLAAMTSGAISLIELISRFSIGTKLKELFGNLIGWIYLTTHICAGLLAMFISQALKIIEFRDGFENIGLNELKAVGVGLAAITILRSDILSLRNGDKKVSIGFGPAVELLLKVLDHKLDIERGLSSGKNIREIMKNVNPQRDAYGLVTIALQSRETMSKEEQKSLRDEVEAIANSTKLSTSEKQFSIGVMVCRVTGIEILRFAVNEFSNDFPEGAELDIKLTNAFNKLEGDNVQTSNSSNLGEVK